MNREYHHQLRPDQLEAMIKEKLVAFWPLGLIEHHGWHLPIGFDGLKAEKLCIRIAEKTGEVFCSSCGGGFGWT